MPRDPAFTAEFIRSTFDYDPKTGKMTWRERVECSKLRNSIWVGREAGGLSNQYWQIAIYANGKRMNVLAHRVAWIHVYGVWPSELLDHRNGKKTDNRISNLREASYSQNAYNRPKRSDNKSGYTGVAFRKNRGTWEGRIMAKGRTLWRKSFPTAREANAARLAALPKFHGEFARMVP